MRRPLRRHLGDTQLFVCSSEAAFDEFVLAYGSGK